MADRFKKMTVDLLSKADDFEELPGAGSSTKSKPASDFPSSALAKDYFMGKRVAVTISAVAFVILAIAMGPNVPAALATAHAMITNDDVKSSQPTVQQSCALLEVWFIDPTCRHQRVKKSARTKNPAKG